MKYKILKETALFKQLADLRKRMDKVKAEAFKVAKSFNGTGRYCGDVGSLAGGISAIEFDEKPEGWRKVGEKWQRFYYPKVTNKEANKKIAPLPTIDYKELNDLIKFSQGAYSNSGGLYWTRCPEVHWFPNYILIAVPEGMKYKPVSGMTEIYESEYQKLNKHK